jgi:hypothetical protein
MIYDSTGLVAADADHIPVFKTSVGITCGQLMALEEQSIIVLSSGCACIPNNSKVPHHDSKGPVAVSNKNGLLVPNSTTHS